MSYTKLPHIEAVAERIRDFDGASACFYIVRDPIDRIESHVAHNIAKGRATPKTHARLLPQALDVSRYAFQLDGLAATLGTTPLLLDFDELRLDPRRTLARCVAHLEIDPDFVFEIRPPANTRAGRNDAQIFRLDEAVRAELRAALHDDVQRFRDVYGFDISAWGFPETAAPAGRAAAAAAAIQAAAEQKPTAQGKIKGQGGAAGLASEPDPTRGARGNYWTRRSEMMYYRYVLEIAGELAKDATSLIDVGSHSTSIAEKFPWIRDRVALDLRKPYSSPTVRGVQADFLAYEPEKRFDFALCLQVLEHVPPVEEFAKKLLRVADRVLVSVPYKWPEGGCKYHCQDPVNEQKLAAWFGRTPDYTIVVQEPLNVSASNRRLIAYFHTPGVPFSLRRKRGGKPKAGTGSKAGAA